MAAPIGILTNINAINSSRYLSVNSNNLNDSMSKLSSGMRINSAADDAAGIAVATGFEAQTRSQLVAQRNANDSVAMLQTLESSYDTLSDILIRARELAVQSSNGTLTDTDRSFIDTEFQQLVTEIDRISEVTEFNGIFLLDGSQATFSFQVGTENTANDRLKVKVAKIDATELKVNGSKVDKIATAQTAIGEIDTALESLNTERSTIGASINQLQWASESLGTQYENLSTALSQIRDVDVARESANFAGQNVLMQAGVSMLAQANQQPQLALRLLG